MKHTALCLVLLIAIVVQTAAWAAGGAETAAPKKSPPPSFKPGAEVTLALTFMAPENYAFNEMLPLSVKFDPEKLKKAAFVVEKENWDFELKPHVGRTTVYVPIKLKDSAPEGSLAIPLQASCIVCTMDGEQCLPVSEGFTVRVTVRAKAPAGEENQALSKGSLPWRHTFSAS